jgi:uncharacterized protein
VEAIKAASTFKITVLSLALGLGLASLAQTAHAQVQTAQANRDNRMIAITATDIATADAEIARVHIGFQVFTRDSDSGYGKASLLSNAIIDAVKKTGVEDRAIESESQYIERSGYYGPIHSTWDENKKQFTVEQSWIATIPAKNAAKVLHAAVEAGANNSGEIDWDVTDRRALEAKAAAKAIEKAQSVAAQMASALHVSLKGLIYASNQPESGEIVSIARFAPGMARNKQVQPLAINPRHIEESATVYAVFAIE